MEFEIKGLNQERGIVSLSYHASNSQDATLQAVAQGFTVLSVRPKRTHYFGINRKNTAFPLVLFSQELSTLLLAGLSLVEALETLAEKETRAEFRTVIKRVVIKLYDGLSFSNTLEQFPQIFPPLYISTIRASERTGDFPEALSRYVAYQMQVDLVRKKLVSASIYPVLLLSVGGLVVLFLLGYVVPRFSVVYEDLGRNLPWLSKVLMNWGLFLHHHGLQLLIGFFFFIALAVYALTRHSVRAQFAKWLWKIPTLGDRFKVYQLARFYRTLGMLQRGGIPITRALDMVSGLLQPGLRSQLNLAAMNIREGSAISTAMENHGLTTPVATRMLRVGERTGRMGEMMERIAAFHDEEMTRYVEWFTRLFEPLLMVAIGITIGLIVILMYLPIFELAGSIQ